MQKEDLSGVYPYLFPGTLYKLADTVQPALTNLQGEEVSSCKLLFVLKNALNHDITATETEQLGKMADWTGLTRKETAVYQIKEQRLSFLSLQKQYRMDYVIGFGILPIDLNLNMEHHLNKTTRFMNCSLLFALPFAVLQRDGKSKNDFFEEAASLFRPLKKQKS